ncbi:MAG: HEAT repeat domain-containing protein [Spirochaetales bacterium]|nr:HEAT repeat domain-containing protein [Spirochaetales bacterium]
MVRKIIPPIPLFFLFSSLLAAQSTGVSDPYDTSGAVFVGDNSGEKAEENLQSIRDERREVLLYGIEAEVKEVVGLIRQENDDSYNEELLMILGETENPSLAAELYAILAEFEEGGAEELALADLSPILEDYRYQEKRALAAITYLGDMKSQDSVDLLYDLAKKDEPGLTGRVIYNLGKIGDSSRADELLDLYDEYQGDDSNDIAMNIITAWGEMKYAPAFDTLLDIIEDSSASHTEREYAAVALGKLGDLEALDPLINLYNDEGDNSMIRAFAVSGLMYFEDPRVEDLLLQALKRDSYWKIRVTACEGLARMGSEEAIDILDFKLRRDSEKNVKKAAAKALGEYGNGPAGDILVDYFKKESNSAELRLEVFKVLLDKKIDGTVPAFEEVMELHWDKKDTQLEFLKRCCQQASVAEWDALSGTYRRMLAHVDNYIQIYGIRGIRVNGISALYGEVKDLDQDGVNGLVRREAKSLE